MYRRLYDYKQDYFGDIDISKNNNQQKKHSPIVIHAENLTLTLSHHHPLPYFWKWTKEVPIFSNLNFEIGFGKLFGIIASDGMISHSFIIIIFFLYDIFYRKRKKKKKEDKKRTQKKKTKK